MSQGQGIDTWSDALKANERALEAVIRQDPFLNWDKNRMPEALAERRLTMGLSILYGCHDHPMAQEYLQQAVRVADRAIAEDRWNEGLMASAFPQNRGRAIRTRVYSAAMLGEPLRQADLITVSGDYEQWCRGYKGRQWNDQAEAYYLAAVRALILGGDVARAKARLQAREFRNHSGEVGSLRLYLQGDLDRRPLVGFLDEIRRPDFRPPAFMEWEIVRLEIAMMYSAKAPSVLGAGVDREAVLNVIGGEALEPA